MKRTYLAGVAAAALFAGTAQAEQLTVFGPWLGPDQEIAVFPQPGLAADMAKRGFLSPLKDGTGDWIRENYAAGQSWVDLGTYADEGGADNLYGFFYKVDVKSLVWYSPENFEDAGYEIPTTMEDLKALSDQIVADGGTPWCIGLGSGGATGWPATDWVEDMMLRTQSPAVYDAWVANELPFDAPEVIAAIEEFGGFARNDAYVAGGAGAVASTDFRDSPKGIFSSPPQCYMHRQASFIPAFFPEGTSVGEDADFFYFPAYAGKDLGSPVLGAFADPTLRKMNEILLGATTFRFDGSDLMPGAVGAGSFWTGMVDYAGGKDAGEVAAGIQASCHLHCKVY